MILNNTALRLKSSISHIISYWYTQFYCMIFCIWIVAPRLAQTIPYCTFKLWKSSYRKRNLRVQNFVIFRVSHTPVSAPIYSSVPNSSNWGMHSPSVLLQFLPIPSSLVWVLLMGCWIALILKYVSRAFRGVEDLFPPQLHSNSGSNCGWGGGTWQRATLLAVFLESF